MIQYCKEDLFDTCLWWFWRKIECEIDVDVADGVDGVIGVAGVGNVLCGRRRVDSGSG